MVNCKWVYIVRGKENTQYFGEKIMVITILFLIYVLIVLVDLIRQLIWQKKIKRMQTRADFRHVEMLGAYLKLEIAINNDNEIKSLKRHIRALLNAMEKAAK